MNFRQIVIATLLCCATTAAWAQTSLKVMSYNLRFGELASLEELAAFIKNENPDLVALQEVDVRTNRPAIPHQHGKDFISELAFRTGMLALYGKTIPHTGGYYGIGILTKYPYFWSRCTLLPMPEGAKEQRALLFAEIELPDGRSCVFACTHLDHSTSAVRQAQVDSINRVLLPYASPVVLCGDFNNTPESKEIKTGMNQWVSCSGHAATFPAKAPDSKIDYIFCRPRGSWIEESTYTPETPLSDHLPVVSTLTLP